MLLNSKHKKRLQLISAIIGALVILSTVLMFSVSYMMQ